MDNKSATAHPFWSLTPEALASQATAPVAAQHGDRCACRHCASGSYQDLLQKSDYQRHEITRLTAELNKTRFARDVERYRFLTLAIAIASSTGNQEAWAKHVAERLGLGVAVQQAADAKEAA